MKWMGRLFLSIYLTLSIAYGANGNMHTEESTGKSQRFRFDPEASYTIISYPGVPTDIQLSPAEHVTGFAVGDTVQWVIEELPGHLFIKPMRADLFTAGTLVTDHRTYQLAFKSSNSKENWMQRVSWSYPDLVILRATESSLPHAAERVPFDLRSTLSRSPIDINMGRSSQPRGIDPSKLNMDYQIKGDAPFRPISVFDDGRSMWIKMPPHEPLPAVFAETEEGGKLVHYAIQEDWIVLPRLIPKLTLKLGASEIHIARKNSEGTHDIAGK
jgi:type IV secretion system protein VirB9